MAGEQVGIDQLLQRWHAGDRAALDQLLARTMPFLSDYASRRLGDAMRRKEETQDVVQDAVINFMEYGPRFALENEGHFRALLCKIVDNTLLGHHQWFSRQRRDLRREHPLPATSTVRMGSTRVPTPSESANASEREAMVRLALETLDPLDHKIFSMHLYSESSFAEIGAELGMKEGTVRMRYHRALPKLSRQVKALQDNDLETFFS